MSKLERLISRVDELNNSFDKYIETEQSQQKKLKLWYRIVTILSVLSFIKSFLMP